MNSLSSRLALLGFGAAVIASSLTVSSCRDKFPAEFDTVYVHDTMACGTWMLQNSHTQSGLIEIESANGYVNVVGDAGTVVRSADGENWSVKTPAQAGQLYGVHFFDASNGIVIGDGQSLYRTNNGGNSWSSMQLPTTGKLRNIFFPTPSLGFILVSGDNPAGTPGEILRTTDGGASWANVNTTSNGLYGIAQAGSRIVVSGKFGHAYYSDDNGATWNAATTDVSYQITHIAFTSSTEGFAVGGDADVSTGFILHTTDAGQSWSTIETKPYMIQALAINSNGRITTAGFGGHIVESNDGGGSWSETTFGNQRWISAAYVDDAHILLVGSNGRIASRFKE